MKTLLVLCVSLVSAMAVANDEQYEVSEETYTTEQAPADVVSDLVDICKDWAQGDNIAEGEQYSYVLECVNQELKLQGFDSVGQVSL